MTGGEVVILGPTGSNFAAGMSGGIAYLLDFDEINCNKELILLDTMKDSDYDTIHNLISNHLKYTGSTIAKEVLDDWEASKLRFTKIIPKDFKRIKDYITKFENDGYQTEEATRMAFEKVIS